MKLQLLAAVASVALISAGVAAQAQDNPKHDQRPAAEQQGGAAPSAGGAMKNEAPKAAETQHKEAPKAAEMQHKEGSKAAETQHQEAPKAAETQHKEGSKAAETQHKEAPKAAETQHKEGSKAAESQHNQMERQGEARDKANSARHADERDEKGMKSGASGKQNEAQRANRPARVTGKVKISHEHVQRVSETLRRDSRPEHVDINVRIGERIPQTVVVRPLPADVITIVPEYRGYDYFIDSDDEIVFVSPRTHEIVGTIDEGSSMATTDETRISGARPCPVND